MVTNHSWKLFFYVTNVHSHHTRVLFIIKQLFYPIEFTWLVANLVLQPSLDMTSRAILCRGINFHYHSENLGYLGVRGILLTFDPVK